MNAVTVSCPAKVNLFLRIVAREESGYHQIETALQAISLADRIEVRRSAETGISLRIRRPPPAPGGGGDLIGDMGEPRRQHGRQGGARLPTRRRASRPERRSPCTRPIPAGTGLGGGSSDAAGVLAALNSAVRRPPRAERARRHWRPNRRRRALLLLRLGARAGVGQGRPPASSRPRSRAPTSSS